MKFTFKLLLSSTLLFACAHSSAHSEKPDTFALRFPVQIEANVGLQRLALPPAALAAIRSNNFADVRVFNANGDAVPMALLPQRTETTVPLPRTASMFPINVTQAQEQNLGGLQLRIDERAGQRTVIVDAGKPSTPAGTQTRQIGALIDTSALVTKLDAIMVDADLPIGEPVSLTVSASKDLKNWRVLAEAPVFRFGGEGSPGNLRVPLNSANLDKEYLRVTWPSNTAIKLRGVQTVETPSAAVAARTELSLTVSKGSSENEAIIAVPFATPIHALALRASVPNTLVPVRIHVRNAKSEPWRFVTSSVVYRIASGNAESTNPPLELNGLIAKEIRIEADRNPNAFATALPSAHAVVNPVNIAFVTSGNPPFTLAVGNKEAKPVTLPLSSVIPGYVDGSETKLAQATVDVVNVIATAPAAPTTLSAIKEKVGAPSERSLVLWGVLIAGVLLLGGLAWSMVKPTGEKSDGEKS
ncbi:MAG: DUF3999 domain-containing protein [Betaproteobacteria bacterium]|nr:MAG: DUF3999 domain-containing protein [Betaproteobacteria bacterium]